MSNWDLRDSILESEHLFAPATCFGERERESCGSEAGVQQQRLLKPFAHFGWNPKFQTKIFYFSWSDLKSKPNTLRCCFVSVCWPKQKGINNCVGPLHTRINSGKLKIILSISMRINIMMMFESLTVDNPHK